MICSTNLTISMFSHIKTSKENKEVVTRLTNKLNLGPENMIARIALAYSLTQDKKLDINDLKDSGGKEYSKNVLFGDYFDIYFGIICLKYNLNSNDKDLPRYIKLHLDHGLESLSVNAELESGLINFITKSI